MGCQGGRVTFRVLCALLLGALLAASSADAANASTVSVGDVQVNESDGSATFSVTRSAGLLAPALTLQFETVAGSAAANQDYGPVSGLLTFGFSLLGSETQTVAVPITNDTLDEDSETFRLVVSGPEVVDGDATATIVDDDPPPVLSVLDSAAVSEGAAGARASFVVRLLPASGRRVSVAYATADAGATAGQDYTANTGTLVLNAGATEATVNVPVLDDGADEPAESFELRLASPVNATLGDGVGSATIVDDDPPPASPGAPPPPPAGGGTQQPSRPAVPLPIIGTTSPPAGTTSGSASGETALGVSSPRLKRPSTVLVTISCPRGAGRCSGQITIFTIPNRHSKIKTLRRERKLGRLTFAVAGGQAQTLALKLGRRDNSLLRRTGRLRVRAYALTRDAAGRAGVRSVSGTLIARTAHSSPSRG
jgi:hypothetical protein